MSQMKHFSPSKKGWYAPCLIPKIYFNLGLWRLTYVYGILSPEGTEHYRSPWQCPRGHPLSTPRSPAFATTHGLLAPLLTHRWDAKQRVVGIAAIPPARTVQISAKQLRRQFWKHTTLNNSPIWFSHRLLPALVHRSHSQLLFSRKLAVFSSCWVYVMSVCQQIGKWPPSWQIHFVKP